MEDTIVDAIQVVIDTIVQLVERVVVALRVLFTGELQSQEERDFATLVALRGVDTIGDIVTFLDEQEY